MADNFTAPPLFEPGELRAWAGFAGGALKRRRKLALEVFVFVVAATVLALPLLPRRYHVEAKVLALPSDGAPGVARQSSGDPAGLLESAAQVALTHENLVSIVRAQDLVSKWDADRGRLSHLWHRTAPTERDLVRRLQKTLTVKVKGEEVLIAFDWPEPQTAVAVVEAAQKNLLAARREAELSPLERKATSLEQSAAEAQKRVDLLTSRVTTAVRLKRRGARAATVRALQADGKFRDLPDPALASQRLELIGRRRAIAELEETRQKRLSELNATLAEQRATLGPENAALQETQQKIASLAADQARIDRMRADEQTLLATYVRGGGRETELSAEPGPAWPAELKEDDPAVAFDKARIAMEESNLSRLQAEVADARQALAAAQVSFESRYMVMTPPEAPDGPSFPNVPLLLLAAVLGGALAASIGVIAAEALGGEARAEERLALAEAP
ncbi:MAG: hypothetical protein ABR567_19610 [Myxococcales bacterium]|nr:hypothetical protein [Myxococcales bacterium]